MRTDAQPYNLPRFALSPTHPAVASPRQPSIPVRSPSPTSLSRQPSSGHLPSQQEGTDRTGSSLAEAKTQQPYVPRLHINAPPQPVPGMLTSPSNPYFASPASYGQLPFGGGMVSPGAPSPGGFFPPHVPAFQPHYGGPIGLGAPPMALQRSFAGSEAPSMMRSTSTSSTASTSTIPPTPANFSSAFFPSAGPAHQHHSQVFSPPMQTGVGFCPPMSRSDSLPGPSSRGKLHASTPSFHPGQSPPAGPPPGPLHRPHHAGRTQSISVRPAAAGLKSPTLTRTASTSPAPSSTGFGMKDEPKKKRLIVRLPRERDEEDVVVDGKEGRKQSTMKRQPLSELEKKEIADRMEVDAQDAVTLEEDELTGRGVHFEEVKMKGLPETLEVFMPGKEAWDDVWDQFVQETTEKYGYFDLRKPSFLPSSRANSFLQGISSPSSPSASGFSTPNPRTNGKHGRAASLFTATPSSLPPRLASVLDNLRRPSGHSSSLSLSFSNGIAALRSSALSSPGTASPNSDGGSGGRRLTPYARTFTMPGCSSSGSSTEAAERTPLPASPLSSAPEQKLPTSMAPAGSALPLTASTREKWKPSLQELGRGFGIEEEDEETAEDAEAASLAAELDEVVGKEQEGPSPEGVEGGKDKESVINGGRASEPPSRRTSTLSTRTDNTGVASQSDGFQSLQDGDEGERPDASMEATPEPEAMDDPTKSSRSAQSPSLSNELCRALSDLGPVGEAPRSPPTQSLPPLPDLPAIEIHVNHDKDYQASDTSDWVDAELSQSEYSDPDVEEEARVRAVVRARSTRALRQEALEQHQHLFRANEGTDGYTSEPDYGTGRASSLAIDPVSHFSTFGSELFFQAPSDIDVSDVEKGGHKIAQGFEFPPRSTGNSPVMKRAPEHIALPSSPESLSNAVQPGLPSFTGFGARRLSLGIIAPDFSFGGAALARHSSTASIGTQELAFGGFGHPGSLAASPSLRPDSPFGDSLTPLNPVASEFRPPTSDSPFALRQQGSVASLGSAMGWGDLGKPGSITASSPGFPPEQTPPHLSALANEFRPLSVDQSFDFTPPNAPTLDMSAAGEDQGNQGRPRQASGRGPLPPIPLTTVAPHNAAVKRQKVEGESPWLPSGSTTGQMPQTVSAPRLAHPQPRRPLPVPPLEQLEQLQHPRVQALDADYEESTLRHDGSETGNASLMSLDDPLPEQYAPSQLVVSRKALGAGASSSRPFSLQAKVAPFTEGGRVLGFQGVTGGAWTTSGRKRSPLPSFQTPGSYLDAGAKEQDREVQVSPNRMGDPRARQESVDKALPNSSRPKSRAVPIPPKRDNKGTDIFDEVEAIPLTPGSDDGGSVLEVSGDEDGPDEDDLPLRILEGIISSQFESLKSDLANVLRPQPYQDDFVDAFATRVELLLATASLRENTPAELASLLADGQERTERAVLQAVERFHPPSALSLAVPPRPYHPEPQISLSAPVTPTRPLTPGFDGGPAAAYGAFLDDLRATVLPLTKETVNIEALSAKIASLMKPPLVDILSRLSPKDQDAAPSLAEQVKQSLDTFAASAQVEKAVLGQEVAHALQPTLDSLKSALSATVAQQIEEKIATATLRSAEVGEAPSLDIEGVVARLAEVVKAGTSSSSALDAALSAIEAIKTSQDKIATSTSATQEAQVSLKSTMGQLGLDVTSRLDVAYSQLEILFNAHLASSSGATGGDEPNVADLEIQLTKARNDHGKVRSEKAVLTDRLEAEKARHAAEVDDLRKQLAKQSDALRASEVEKAVSAAQAERMQQDVAALKTRCGELEEKRNLARKSLEEENARRHLREQAATQQKGDILRLQHELQQIKATAATGEREQLATQHRLDVALSERDRVVEEKQKAKEALAAAKATGAALEKRLSAQDDRLNNLQRVKIVQQQTLAATNQRNAELRKDALSLKPALAELSVARSTVTDLETAILASSERCKALGGENDRYRQQFVTLEKGLETTKTSVARELNDASTRIKLLSDERDRLAAENAHLADEKERLLARSQNGLSTHFSTSTPTASRYYTPLFPTSAPNTPPTFTLSNGVDHKLAALTPQHTGDSVGSDETIAHTTFSPTPSVSGRSFVLEDDGWYTSA
ncbi:hypothetical protein JCM11641_007246 [Rhodosporidiobolus odoratus]